jgi:hypothetical protein
MIYRHCAAIVHPGCLSLDALVFGGTDLNLAAFLDHFPGPLMFGDVCARGLSLPEAFVLKNAVVVKNAGSLFPCLRRSLDIS